MRDIDKETEKHSPKTVERPATFPEMMDHSFLDPFLC